jgi:thioredoxin-like negative regulator of GroEL
MDMKGLLVVAATIAMSEGSPAATYEAAYRQSQSEGRPLVVLVGAEWCSACRTMKGASLPEASRHGALDDVAFAMVDFDAENELAKKLLRGDTIPQLVMFYRDAAGSHRVQLTGVQDATAIARFLQQGAAAQSEARVAHGLNAQVAPARSGGS